MDWTRRGVSGMVAAKSGNEVTLKIRTLAGESQAVVTVTEKTSFKRYAPDSVKFADAKSSKLAEISVGDQVRARGVKSEDGLKVTAEDVVFGTFVTKAGTITAVNAETREITVKDLANNKPLVIRITADSQIKKMPDMAGMMGGMAGGSRVARRGRRASGGMARGGMPGGGRGMDINAMLERMPLAKLEDLKAGETIVVSSTKGAKSNEVTAIMMLANADGILQMIAAQSGGGRGAGMPGAGGMGGMMGGGGWTLWEAWASAESCRRWRARSLADRPGRSTTTRTDTNMKLTHYICALLLCLCLWHLPARANCRLDRRCEAPSPILRARWFRARWCNFAVRAANSARPPEKTVSTRFRRCGPASTTCA